MSAPTSWAWTVYDTNGTTVLSTFTTQNPSYTFPAAATYYARLVAANSAGSSDTGLVAVPVTEPPAFTHIRTVTANVVENSPNGQITLPAIAVGDLILVTFLGIGSDGGITGLTDPLGNIYNPIAPTQQIPGGGWGKDRTFWCIATNAGTNVVLIGAFPNPTPAGSQGSIVSTQYAVTGTVTLLDHKEGSGADVAGPVDVGTVVAGVGNLLIYGNGLWGATVPTLPGATPAWNARLQSYVADRLNVDAGSHTFQPTYAGTQNWIAQLAVFTVDTPPPPPPPPPPPSSSPPRLVELRRHVLRVRHRAGHRGRG